MIFMHMQNIVHRDMKPANIMQMALNRYSIIDFGEGINLTYSG